MRLAWAAVALMTATAAQPPATVRPPYLDAVRQYGPGTEDRAVLTVLALPLDSSKEAVASLDAGLCRLAGARSCDAGALARLDRRGRGRLAGLRRAYHPRALALHVEALAASDPLADAGHISVHREIVLRLIDRLAALAREPDATGTDRRLPVLGRHLLLWTLQYLRDLDGLGRALDAIEPVAGPDVDVRLARAAHAELRALPDAVRAGVAARSIDTPLPREARFAQEEARRIEAAATVYETLLATHPDVLEAHLRLARLLLRLGRPEPALSHARRVAALGPDARQAYLASLFEADALARLERRGDAIAAYGRAERAWPGAQAPAIGLARLHAIAGEAEAARAALRALDLERPAGAPERTEPWIGYVGAQAWRLPDGIRELQAALPALPDGGAP